MIEIKIENLLELLYFQFLVVFKTNNKFNGDNDTMDAAAIALSADVALAAITGGGDAAVDSESAQY